jgi:hypothetical protein
MVEINMIGGGFQHDICSSALNKNKHVSWRKDNLANISIHIDDGLNRQVNKNKLNFGWICESSSIVPNIINDVLNRLDYFQSNFKYIFTHDKRIVEKNPNFFKFVLPNACPWIQNRKIYNKSKNISIIVSNKNSTAGHRYRLSVLQKYNTQNVDRFGRGTSNELPWTIVENGIEESGKIIGLKDYRYSFCFENDNYESIFVEKITDCFATGTIPIFWGTPSIGEYFNKDGIIIFDENSDYSNLNEDFYDSKKLSIEDNFQRCIDLSTSEDYFYKNYIE